MRDGHVTWSERTSHFAEAQTWLDDVRSGPCCRGRRTRSERRTITSGSACNAVRAERSPSGPGPPTTAVDAPRSRSSAECDDVPPLRRRPTPAIRADAGCSTIRASSARSPYCWSGLLGGLFWLANRSSEMAPQLLTDVLLYALLAVDLLLLAALVFVLVRNLLKLWVEAAARRAVRPVPRQARGGAAGDDDHPGRARADQRQPDHPRQRGALVQRAGG